MQDYVLSLSYGKDSVACLFAIKKLGWPLTRIITSDVWATDSVPAAPPPMQEFKEYFDQWCKNRFGIQVEHVYAMRNGEKATFEKVFYTRRKTAKAVHKIHQMYGWPYQKGPWCNNRLKINAMKTINRNAIQYLGIAADETERIFRHGSKANIKLPLVEIGWTEADCLRICKENGVLSPIYETGVRGGCWFCHNQGVDQLRLLRKNYPEYWKLMLKWDSDSPVTFKAGGRTVHDYDKRFAMEDAGLIDTSKRFLWEWVEEYKNEQ